MDHYVRSLAEDQARLGSIPGEVVEESIELGQRLTREFHPSQHYKENYKGLAESAQESANNPVGVDRNIANQLMEADIDRSTIDAILSESPEFQELAQIQGEEKARQYLNLIVNDAERQNFLNKLQEQQLTQVEVLENEEEL